jgi:hypothetical protein
VTEHTGYARVDEVMRVYGVTTAAKVYRIAHRAGWRRYTLDGKVRYRRDQVHAYFHRDREDASAVAS